MKLITLNLRADADRWDERLPLILEILTRVQPDIVAFQEVRLKIQQAHLIADALNTCMSHDKYHVHLCEDWYEPHILANGFLSRVPVLEHERIELPQGFRTAQRITVLMGKTHVNIANTHLHHKPAREETIRLPQMKCLLDWLLPLKTPLVLMGDMNARPDTATVALAKQYFTSAYEQQHGCEPASTFPTPLRTDKVLAPRTIDYIFVHDLTITAARLIANEADADDATLYPSDHFGLYAEVQATI